MFRVRQNKADYNFRVWHLVATVVVMGFTMHYALHPFEIPKQSVNYATWYGQQDTDILDQEPWSSAEDDAAFDATFDADPTNIEVLPFDLTGEVPGPLLTRILQRYLPDSTPTHADDLRGTLPPGENPRMIVILPTEDSDTLY